VAEDAEVWARTGRLAEHDAHGATVLEVDQAVHCALPQVLGGERHHIAQLAAGEPDVGVAHDGRVEQSADKSAKALAEPDVAALVDLCCCRRLDHLRGKVAVAGRLDGVAQLGLVDRDRLAVHVEQAAQVERLVQGDTFHRVLQFGPQHLGEPGVPGEFGLTRNPLWSWSWSWVVGRGSWPWVVGRHGSWVVGGRSWVVVGRGSWAVVGRRSSTRSSVVACRSWDVGRGTWVVVGRRSSTRLWVISRRSSVVGLRSWVVGRGVVMVAGRGSWVVGRGSWVVERGSLVAGRGSWVVVVGHMGRRSSVVGRGSWVVSGRRSSVVDEVVGRWSSVIGRRSSVVGRRSCGSWS